MEAPADRYGRTHITTPSSVLISSSPYLNDPRIREWITNESLRRNGNDYPLLYGMPTMLEAVDQVRDTDRVNQLIRKEREINPALDRWFGEGFMSTFTRDDLGDYPQGSVGRRLYDYMVEYDLDTELDPRRKADPDWAPKSDLEYYNIRTAQTHDFDHILGEIGFGSIAEIFATGLRTGNMYRHVSPELAGELLLINTLIIFPWFTRTMLHYPETWPALWDNMTYGYDAGQESDLLFTARYEDVFAL